VARRTISGSGSLKGIGLHTGAETTIACHSAQSGTGVVFRRLDLDGSPEVRARISEVDVTDRHTAIGHGEQTIHTVEHVLAAVAAHQLDDVVFEIDGPEPPILDGSFRPFYDLLLDAGPTDHAGEPVVYKITAPLQVKEGDSSYVVAPADDLRITATIDFAHPLIRTQVGSYAATTEVFDAELADSRTFGFMAEVDTLRAKGLIQGASTANAVVLSEDGVVDSELRWADEFVRHKAGDMLGDLALIGGRIEAHIVAVRPSHRGNIALARAIARTAEPRGGYAMDIG
jgi:UDP-3-O-acyl N-acetylglucosamine deacetylase